MRTALIAIFLSAAMASPLAAQVEDEAVIRADDGSSPGARSEEREQRRAERESRREVQRESRESREPEARPEPRRHEEPAQERVERTESGISREGVQRTLNRVFGSRERDRDEHRRDDRTHRRDRDHRETHRDYRRDHDALHRRDPTRREHDRFHREVNRDHNRWHQRWDHNWRRDSRYDWQRYRYSNRDLFRVGRYSSPYRGYRYRPISIGIRLGSGFYSHPYWINDPWRYRLPHAYAGTRWVRYYDDVVLVDLFTGEVVDVIYNFFW